LANGEAKYVACFVERTGTTISRDDKQTFHKFSIWFCDLVSVGRENKNDVESDLFSIAQDYLAMLNYTGYQDDWNISTVYNAEYYEEKFEDLVGAVKIDVLISVDFLSDRCSVPANDVTFEPTKDMIVNNYIYTGSGNEGTQITVNSLIGKQILMLFMGDKLLTPISNNPSPNQYSYDANSGLFTFGVDIQNAQIIQFLNRNLC